MNRIMTLSTVAALLCASTAPVLATDARSIALGGSVIANGKGVHGALRNPASMMAMQRRGESTHIRIGFNAEFRADGDMVDALSDDENDDLISDIEREVDILSGAQLTCNPILDSDDTPCINNTQPLSDLSGRLLDLIDDVDEESVEGVAAADLGMAYTGLQIPFAINLHFSATGTGTPDVADGDRGYISEFNTLLDGDTLTLGELSNASFLQIEDQDNTLSVRQPEDVLATSAEGGALLRTQLSVSLARTFDIAGHSVDFGVTPKFSSLVASSLDINIADEFLDNTASASDRFKDSEKSESSFTADVGGSMMLPTVPVQLAAVIRNLIPESISTREGFKFDTTPQMIIGAAYHKGLLSLTGDLALNSAKQDSFDTQKIGLGVEYGTQNLAIRGGISHDAARDTDGTALSLGFALGPLEVGGRLTELESIELGAQLAYSFK